MIWLAHLSQATPYSSTGLCRSPGSTVLTSRVPVPLGAPMGAHCWVRASQGRAWWWLCGHQHEGVGDNGGGG